ncbi:hypothetical protein [Streptomyces sp. NPDC001903]|uniref:hypothetical protein n=1 Tax=Streptomyces sp. NPDC001903 TaxID=3364622 RepID=UPI003676CEE0
MIAQGCLAFTLDDVAARTSVSPAAWRRQHHAAFTAAVKPFPGSSRPPAPPKPTHTSTATPSHRSPKNPTPKTS